MENYPTYNNLLGRIEHEVIMGASRTDFTMIQSGALHRANGGYLILPVRDLLLNPYAWEGLKRALRDGEIRMVELANQVGLISTVTLEPEPIPLQVKILLVGSPTLYYSLRAYDDDFTKLFKVRAEFAYSDGSFTPRMNTNMDCLSNQWSWKTSCCPLIKSPLPELLSTALNWQGIKTD